MTMFVGVPEERPIDALDFAEVLEQHRTFVDNILAAAKPGKHGIDWDQALLDAAAIRDHRDKTGQELGILLRRWEPEFEIEN